jgi:GH18 family chitinase
MCYFYKVMAHNTPWSKKEERIIINNKDLSLDELCKLLPHRTKTAVSHRRNYLGLGKSVYTRPWTAKKDSILKNNLELSLEKLQKMLPNKNKVENPSWSNDGTKFY